MSAHGWLHPGLRCWASQQFVASNAGVAARIRNDPEILRNPFQSTTSLVKFTFVDIG